MPIFDLIINTLANEFSDGSNVDGVIRVVMRLILAACLGGLIGFNRAAKGKAAGLRTHMLVSLGSAIFVFVPQQAGASIEDVTRILQGLVAGIGFLGSGVIIKDESTGKAFGITTAASIWFTAALGMTVGMGREATAIISAVLALIILSFIPKFSDNNTI